MPSSNCFFTTGIKCEALRRLAKVQTRGQGPVKSPMSIAEPKRLVTTERLFRRKGEPVEPDVPFRDQFEIDTIPWCAAH